MGKGFLEKRWAKMKASTPIKKHYSSHKSQFDIQIIYKNAQKKNYANILYCYCINVGIFTCKVRREMFFKKEKNLV